SGPLSGLFAARAAGPRPVFAAGGNGFDRRGVSRHDGLAAAARPAARFGACGLALAGKALGLDAGGWFNTAFGAGEDPKSISHEHTFSEDSADPTRLEATLARLSEMVGRRLRENGLH